MNNSNYPIDKNCEQSPFYMKFFSFGFGFLGGFLSFFGHEKITK